MDDDDGSTIRCMKCKKPAITFIRYSGAHLCEEHFNGFVLKRLKKEIRAQEVFKDGGLIAVALSGGKDSLVTLKTLLSITSDHRGVEIEAILIDEGIADYRPSSIKIAKDVCKQLGVKLHIVGFSEINGMQLDAIVDKISDISPCALCGVFRRAALNKVAKDIGAKRIATGHNLDDLAQSIFMNVLNSDMDKLFRLGPHQRVIPGLIPRVYPLRTIPEKEVLLYAMLNKIPVHSQECPYSLQATRGRYRDVISQLEMDNPGTKHSLLNFHKNLVKLRPRKKEVNIQIECSQCSEPAATELCKRCEYQGRIDNVQVTD